MAHPVYKLYFYRRSPKVSGLLSAEFEELSARVNEPAARLGVRRLLDAYMRWSNECYEYFGVELYPSLEAAQEYTRYLEDMDWFGHVQGESFLGIPMDGTANNLTPPEPPAPGEKSVYRVYLSRLTDYGHSLSPDELNAVWAMGNDALSQAGGRPIVGGFMRWNNEQWESFGIERFPSHEAVLSYSQYLTVSGWYRVSQAHSHLGVAIGGELAHLNP